MVKFKDTPIGKIPEDWEVAKLKDIVSYTKGKKPNRLYESKKEDYLVPYLTAENMRDAKNVKWCNPNDKNVVLVKEDEIILIWDGSNAGDVFMGFNGALASTMIKITPKNKNDIISRYFYYQLERLSKKCLKTTTVGTGIPHINKKVFENMIIPLPPLEEQRKIAEILSGVDKAIEKVDKAIAKTKRLKKELMQELLTKGVRHEEFKDTEIGKIPKEWEIVKLEDIAKVFDCKHRTPKYYPEGIPVLLPRNVHEGYISLEDAPRTSYEEYLDLTEKYKPKKGDIIYTRNAKVGVAGIVTTDEQFALGQDLVGIRPLEKINSYYLLYVLNSSIIRDYLLKVQTGSTFKRINLGLIKKFKIPLPPLPEQRKIAEILTTVDKKLELERKRKEKLERIKKGLMNDLLTGRRRVKV